MYRLNYTKWCDRQPQVHRPIASYWEGMDVGTILDPKPVRFRKAEATPTIKPRSMVNRNAARVAWGSGS